MVSKVTYLRVKPESTRKTPVEVGPGENPRKAMFASAEDQELLQIGDNGMPHQVEEVDLEEAFKGMSDWFINMVETTDGINKEEILNDLKSVERDTNSRIRLVFPTPNDANRPLSPVLPTRGICTEPIYSSMQLMRIPLFETLPSSPKSPNSRVSFLGIFDGRVQLHIFQESGIHHWQWISINMTELQRLLAHGPDILMDGVRR
jgi:hypothetical protein